MNFVVGMKCQLISETVVIICLQQMFYNSTLFAIVTGNNGFAYFARARPEKKDWGEMNCEFASLQLPPRGAGGVDSCFLVRDAG